MYIMETFCLVLQVPQLQYELKATLSLAILVSAKNTKQENSQKIDRISFFHFSSHQRKETNKRCHMIKTHLVLVTLTEILSVKDFYN